MPGPRRVRGPGQRGGRSPRDPGARMVGDVMSAAGSHRGVADAGEVALDVADGGDAREDRAGRVGRGHPDPGLAGQPAEPAPRPVQVDRVAGQRVPARGVGGRTRGQVAGVKLFGVRPGQGAATGDEGERDQGQQRARHQRDDAAWRPAVSGRRRVPVGRAVDADRMCGSKHLSHLLGVTLGCRPRAGQSRTSQDGVAKALYLGPSGLAMGAPALPGWRGHASWAIPG